MSEMLRLNSAKDKKTLCKLTKVNFIMDLFIYFFFKTRSLTLECNF